MAFPWSKSEQKVGWDERSEPHQASETPPATPTGAVGALLEQFDKLGTLMGEAHRELTVFLASQAAAEPVAALGEKLDVLARKLEQFSASAATAKPQEAPAGPVAAAIDPQSIVGLVKPLDDKLAGLARVVEAQSQAVARLQEQIDRGFEQLGQWLASQAPAQQHEPVPVEPAAVAEPEPAAPVLADWQQALLGRPLVANPALAAQRERLLEELADGDGGARSLVGQLLVFQSAPAERMPQLLKDVGEAYYRWQPKRPGDADPFEEALAAWLQKACEAAGIYNTIELVHPGERFDSARHNATSRGVEITEVLGWIVLRDNGKVYTKATVAVR